MKIQQCFFELRLKMSGMFFETHCMYALYWSIQLQSCKCVSINLLYFTYYFTSRVVAMKLMWSIDVKNVFYNFYSCHIFYVF